jgi:hypothetical protein
MQNSRAMLPRAAGTAEFEAALDELAADLHAPPAGPLGARLTRLASFTHPRLISQAAPPPILRALGWRS